MRAADIHTFVQYKPAIAVRRHLDADVLVLAAQPHQGLAHGRLQGEQISM
jgi:hypothetical protein